MASVPQIRMPTVFLLLLSVGQVPLPWIHRHEELDVGELATHVARYHGNMVECDLPAGWHLHVRFPGRRAHPTGDGWNTSNDLEAQPYQQTEPYSLGETNVSSSMAWMASNLASFSEVVEARASIIRIARYDAPFRTLTVRAGLEFCQQLSVWRL